MRRAVSDPSLIAWLAKCFAYTPHDRHLFELALTHRSASSSNYERLVDDLHQHRDGVDDLHRFQEDFRRLLQTYVPRRADGGQRRVVVFRRPSTSELNASSPSIVRVTSPPTTSSTTTTWCRGSGGSAS